MPHALRITLPISHTLRSKTHNQINNKKRFRVNREIFSPEIFIIDENGQRLGIMNIDSAIKLAEERSLDLVEVSPTATPPVCKLLNFAQFKYQSSKHFAKTKIKAKKIDTKGIRLSLRISPHDLDFKINQAKKFLDKGHRVKVELVLRGREKGMGNLAREMIKNFTSKLEGAKMIEPAQMQGNRISGIISA